MARADLRVTGPQATVPRNVAASATRFEFGEPLHIASFSLATGTADTNVFVLAEADTVVIGTGRFGGIALEGAEPKNSSGTLVAQLVNCACPIPNAGFISGQAETVGNIDTAAELLALINNAVLIDHNSTGAADGGQLYTIHDDETADTSAFTIISGNIGKGILDVHIDPRAYRDDVDA